MGPAPPSVELAVRPAPSEPVLIGFYLGLSAYSAALSKYTSASDASIGLLSRLDYPIAFGLAVPLTPGVRFMPTIHWSILYPRALPEGHGSAEALIVRLPAAVQAFDGAFEAVAGLLYREERVYGDGGAVSLNNGTGTASFYAPGESRSSRLFAIDVGAQKEWRRFLFGLDVIVEAPLHSARRTFGVLATVSYRLGETK